jgi:hypothetical protein
MLLAIESFVRVFEDLLTGRAHRNEALPASNDNDDSDSTTRRWTAGRR